MMKNSFFRFFSVIMLLVVAVSLVGCGNKDLAETEAKDTFSKLISAIQKNDMDEVGKYIDTGSLATVSTDDLKDGDIVFEAVFSRLKADMKSCEVLSDEEVEISADLTTIDLMGVLGQCTQIVMNEVIAGKLSDDDEAIYKRTDEVFLEEIRKDNLPTVTNSVNVKIKKFDGNWKLEMSPEFQNAISGGFLSSIENAKKTMGN